MAQVRCPATHWPLRSTSWWVAGVWFNIAASIRGARTIIGPMIVDARVAACPTAELVTDDVKPE